MIDRDEPIGREIQPQGADFMHNYLTADIEPHSADKNAHPHLKVSISCVRDRDSIRYEFSIPNLLIWKRL